MIELPISVVVAINLAFFGLAIFYGNKYVKLHKETERLKEKVNKLFNEVLDD